MKILSDELVKLAHMMHAIHDALAGGAELPELSDEDRAAFYKVDPNAPPDQKAVTISGTDESGEPVSEDAPLPPGVPGTIYPVHVDPPAPQPGAFGNA